MTLLRFTQSARHLANETQLQALVRLELRLRDVIDTLPNQLGLWQFYDIIGELPMFTGAAKARRGFDSLLTENMSLDFMKKHEYVVALGYKKQMGFLWIFHQYRCDSPAWKAAYVAALEAGAH